MKLSTTIDKLPKWPMATTIQLTIGLFTIVIATLMMNTMTVIADLIPTTAADGSPEEPGTHIFMLRISSSLFS
jgi:hypothetical protein